MGKNLAARQSKWRGIETMPKKWSVENHPAVKAGLFAVRKHKGGYRKKVRTGIRPRPYASHPLGTAGILREIFNGRIPQKKAAVIIQAALLHDVVEESNTSFDAIRRRFGSEVAGLVEELTSDSGKIRKIGKTEYLIKKMKSMSSDALLIKLADRLHNLEDAQETGTRKFKEKLARQTTNILDGITPRMAFESPVHKELYNMVRLAATIQKY